MNQSRPERTQNIFSKLNNSLSFQTRLVIFVLFIALTPLILIAARDIQQTQQALTNSAEISLKSGALQTANSLDNFMQNTLDSIGAEAELADVISYLEISIAARTGTVVREQTLQLLKNLTKKDKEHILSYAIVASNGSVLLDSATDVQRNELTDPYFLPVQFSEKPVVSYVSYEKDGTTSITFASIVKNSKGAFIGILRAKYRASVLQDVILKSVGPSPDTSVLLLDQLSIRLVDSQNPELILKSITPLKPVDYSIAVLSKRLLNTTAEEQATNYVDFETALDNAVNKDFFRADITPKIEGDDTIVVAFLKTQPWVVTYSRPTSNFLAEVQQQINTNVTLVLIASILISVITALIARVLTNPITELSRVANMISQGDLNARANINSADEIGVLASTFNSMTNQLQGLLVGLEQRIDERTADLQKSTLKLETISEVGREISIIRDMDTLLNVSVELIYQRFGYYHVGIFLVDEHNEYAFLRAARSVAAEQMLAANYKLRVGQTGLVGNVTRMGQAYIALNTGTDAVHFENPYLPETKSEIALPLRSHNITIGALDIQANTPEAFDDKDIQTLQILADQLAAAIENAQLAQQIEENLKALTLSNRLQTQKVWHGAINQQERPAYEFDGLQVRSVPQNLPAHLLNQLEAGKPIVANQNTEPANKDNKSKNTLLIPLLVLNQIIGVIGLEQEDSNHNWTNEEIAIAQAAANRAALTLDNARLLEESQRRAIKERTIFESTTRIGSALNIENILQATAEELEKVLSGAEVVLQFQPDPDQKTGKQR